MAAAVWKVMAKACCNYRAIPRLKKLVSRRPSCQTRQSAERWEAEGNLNQTCGRQSLKALAHRGCSCHVEELLSWTAGTSTPFQTPRMDICNTSPKRKPWNSSSSKWKNMIPFISVPELDGASHRKPSVSKAGTVSKQVICLSSTLPTCPRAGVRGPPGGLLVPIGPTMARSIWLRQSTIVIRPLWRCTPALDAKLKAWGTATNLAESLVAQRRVLTAALR
mmetsp:Transcript_59722/g.73143  ORF Transcript_59722/g.73143 Transcript_59722/m.73143 type:complete len:221 (+) Transcript_59722:105-767(+)